MKTVLNFLQRGRTWVIGLPFVWLLIFFALPFLILLRISVTDRGGGENPFTPLYSYANGSLQLLLHYNNYLSIFHDAQASGTRRQISDFGMAVLADEVAHFNQS